MEKVFCAGDCGSEVDPASGIMCPPCAQEEFEQELVDELFLEESGPGQCCGISYATGPCPNCGAN